jgi:predicted nucleic acid-binding protein
LILLDTTVLLHAVGDDHALRAACRRLLKAHLNGDVQAATTVEVIQEFAHVRSRRRSREDAVALAREYSALIPLLATDSRDLDLGLTLYESHRRIGPFDAVLAAVTLNRQLDGIASTDQAFGDVAGLPWIDPASLPTPLS